MQSALTIGLAGVALFGLPACGGQEAAAPAATVTVTASPTASVTASATPTTAPASTREIGVQRAIRTAQRSANGSAVEGGRDREQGRPVWYITVRLSNGTGKEMYIDRQTGDIIQERPENLSSVQRNTAPQVSARQAIRRAERVSQGGTVAEFELERALGRPAWYVLTRGGAQGTLEIYLDAGTGDVLRQERD